MKMTNKHGFTLIELMVTVVIMAIMMAGIFRIMRAAGNKADIATSTTKVQQLMTAVESYRNIYGYYPLVHMSGTGRSDGYYPVSFTYRTSNESGMSQDKLQDDPSFGLLSCFVKRATLFGNIQDSEMKSFYQQAVKNGQGHFQDVFPKNERIGKGNALDYYSRQEENDPNLNQLGRILRRLSQDGIIEGLNGHNPEQPIVWAYLGDGRVDHHGVDIKCIDAWKNSLLYKYDGNSAEIVCLGPDGKLGTNDDITSAGR